MNIAVNEWIKHLAIVAAASAAGACEAPRRDELVTRSAVIDRGTDAAESPARLPLRRPSGSTPLGGSLWWSAAVGLGFAGLGIAAWWARRQAGGRLGGGGTLRVLARAALGPRQAVHLVRAGDRVLLIGTGAQAAPALLGEWDAAGFPGEAAARPALAPAPTRVDALAHGGDSP